MATSSCTTVVLVTLLASFAGGVRAQQAVPAPAATGNNASTDSSGSALEEIVVTAQKRRENLQNVGTSITAFSAERLDRLGVTDSLKISQFTPGLISIEGNSGTTDFFSIRGVSQNDFAEHQESPIAVYLDDVYISQAGAASFMLFDTERVEVLRGPQGTLFGRNATGGLLQYISQKPSQDPTASVKATVGEFDQYRLEGVVGGGLTDKIAVRLSMAGNENNAYTRNLAGPALHNGNEGALRAQLSYKDDDSGLEGLLSFRAAAQNIRAGFYKHISSYVDPATGLGVEVPRNVNYYGTCPGCDLSGFVDPVPDQPLTGDQNTVGYNRTFGRGATATLKYHWDGYVVTSISDFTKFTKSYLEDTDASPLSQVEFATRVDMDQYSEELRLDNGSAQAFRWVIGGYGLRINGDYRETSFINLIGETFDNPYSQATETYAAFGQGEYDLTRRLTAILGFRWSHDKKSEDFASNQLSSPQSDSNGVAVPEAAVAPPYLFNPTVSGSDATLNKGDWSGKAELDWHLTPDAMLYLSANRGIKSGGFDAPATATAGIPASSLKFGEETLLSYEVGEKWEFLDRRARLNADVYYYDYRNYQAFNFQGLSQVIFNTPARVAGTEIEAEYSPLNGLILGLGVAYNDAFAKGVPLPNGTFQDRRMAFAPLYNVTDSIRYNYDTSVGQFFVGNELSFRSSYFVQISNAPVSYQGAYYQDDVHAGYVTPSGKAEIRLFADNVTNRIYTTDALDLSSLGFTQVAKSRPRWVGVTFSYRM